MAWADLMLFARMAAALAETERACAVSAFSGAAVAVPACTPTTTMAAAAARAAARVPFFFAVLFADVRTELFWGFMRSPSLVPWGVRAEAM
ncbi:hypothetical protein GCM10010329_16660 [Streptomyces spiroverticillatus]|nr:hypothetical protein GCM10010329_16660 [Streptomyces spiroverticillatus]